MFKYTTINCIYILCRICAHGNSQVAWGIYSITCLNRIPMGLNILSGLDRIRITQTCLFVNNFCIVVALII